MDEFSVWTTQEFELYRSDVLDELSGSVEPANGKWTNRRKKELVEIVRYGLAGRYGQELFVQKIQDGHSVDYLSCLNLETLFFVAAGEQFDLPLELLMHLDLEQAIDFIAGAGKVGKGGFDSVKARFRSKISEKGKEEYLASSIIIEKPLELRVFDVPI